MASKGSSTHLGLRSFDKLFSEDRSSGESIWSFKALVILNWADERGLKIAMHEQRILVWSVRKKKIGWRRKLPAKRGGVMWWLGVVSSMTFTGWLKFPPQGDDKAVIYGDVLVFCMSWRLDWCCLTDWTLGSIAYRMTLLTSCLWRVSVIQVIIV